MYNQEQMFNYIEQWQREGVSVKQFCADHSLRYHVFHYWYKKYRQQNRSLTDVAKQSFSSILLESGVCLTAFAEVIAPTGYQLRLYQPVSTDFLKALIR